MNQIDFYRDLYFRELDRRAHLDDAIGQLVTIISIIGAIKFYVYHNIIEKSIAFDNIVFVLFSLSFIFFCLSVVFTSFFWSKPFSGFTYKYLPSTLELYNHENELKKYNDSIDNVEHKENFEDYLIKTLVETTDENIKINDRRYLYLYRAKTILIASFALLIICISILAFKYNL